MVSGAHIGDLSIAIKAVDDASKVLKSVEKNIEKFSASAQSSISGMNSSWGSLKGTFTDIGSSFSRFAGKFSTELGIIKKAIGVTVIGISALTAGIVVFGTKLGFSAARVEELGFALDAIAKAAGLSSDEVDKSVKSLRDSNIEKKVALSLTAKFIQANLDLTDAEKLATAAKDLAVIAGKDSSETLGMMADAIIKLEPQMLSQVGITTTLTEIYGKYAQETGRTGDSVGDLSKTLTTFEKRQAFTNFILNEGVKATGAYDAAMGSVSKQFRSLTGRVLPDLGSELGELFKPALTEAISSFAGVVKQLGQWFEDNRVLVQAFGQVLGEYVAMAIDGVKEKFLEWYVSVGEVDGIMIFLIETFRTMMDVFMQIGSVIVVVGTFLKDNAKLIITVILLYETLKLTMATVELGGEVLGSFRDMKDIVTKLAGGLSITAGAAAAVVAVFAAFIGLATIIQTRWKEIVEINEEWAESNVWIRRTLSALLGPIGLIIELVTNWRYYLNELIDTWNIMVKLWDDFGRTAMLVINPLYLVITVLQETMKYIGETGNWWEGLKKLFSHPIEAAINIVKTIFTKTEGDRTIENIGAPGVGEEEGDGGVSSWKDYLDEIEMGGGILADAKKKIDETVEAMLNQGDTTRYAADETKKLARAAQAAGSANASNAKGAKKVAKAYENIGKQMKSYSKAKKNLKKDYKRDLDDMERDYERTMLKMDEDFVKTLTKIREKFNADMVSLKEDLVKTLKSLDDEFQKNELDNEASHKNSVAGVIISKEDELAGLKSQYADADTLEQRDKLDAQIKEIEDFLEKHKDYYLTNADEIKAIRDFNALDDIEKLVFKHAQETAENLKQYNEEKATLTAQYEEKKAARILRNEEEKKEAEDNYAEAKVEEAKHYDEEKKDRKKRFKDRLKDIKDDNKDKLKELKDYLEKVKAELKDFYKSKYVKKTGADSKGLEGVDFDPEGKPLMRAKGGPIPAGVSSIVGEEGPELIVPARNSLVVPNNILSQLGKDSGTVVNNSSNTEIVVNVGMYAGSYTEKRKLGEEIMNAYNQTREAKGLAPL